MLIRGLLRRGLSEACWRLIRGLLRHSAPGDRGLIARSCIVNTHILVLSICMIKFVLLLHYHTCLVHSCVSCIYVTCMLVLPINKEYKAPG